MFQLTGKVAVVTGGGSGIGAAIATLFGRQGASVVVLDVDEDAAVRTANAIQREGGASDARRCDVTQPASVRDGFNPPKLTRSMTPFSCSGRPSHLELEKP